MLPCILLSQGLVCAQPVGLGGSPVLTGHCQVGLLPLPNTHCLWPNRDLGCPALSRATLPPYQGEAVGATQRWQCWLASGSVPRLCDASAENLESSRSTPSFSAGQLHNLPQLCSEFCVATGRKFQDLVHTCTILLSCCLAAGRGVTPWAPGNGKVFASKRAWPASRVGAAAPPCWSRLCAPNRSFLGSPEPGPGHRGGSSGDMLDTGFEEQAWPGIAPASFRMAAPIPPGMRGLCAPRGGVGILKALGWAILAPALPCPCPWTLSWFVTSV